ncbi:MAG: GNAT family N-acetyltransferase [Planctomycetia bacterium]|nr:GNAT family N-acetyltransferase [Planctomycetia bacterium]
MGKVECQEGNPSLAAAYLKFAATQFGATKSAANERYLSWLYEHNPFGGQWSDSLMAVTAAGDVVGCVHAMNVPWRVGQERVVVPAIHNLMVAPEHRQGIGMKMVMKTLQQHDLSIIPSAVEPLGMLYRRLKCVPLASNWYRRVLSPLKIGWQLGAQKVMGWNPTACHFPQGVSAVRLPSAHGAAWWATVPTDTQLEQLANVFNAARTTASGPEFSPEFLRWRFFHELSPRHAVVWLEENGIISDSVILSLGPRQGFNVGRIIAAQASESGRFAALVKLAEHLIQKHGGTLLFTFCASPELNQIYADMGWKPQVNGPQTFLSARKGTLPTAVSLNGEAVDIGFEALPAAA